MRRSLLSLVIVLLLAGAAAAVAADRGNGDGDGDGDRRRWDDRDDDREDGGDDGDDGRDGDEDDKDDRREGRKEKKAKDAKAKAPKRHASAPAPAAAPEPPQPAPQPVPVAVTGDAALRQTVRNEPGRVTYVFLVGGLGPDKARDVTLAAELPDLAATWTLSGAGSEACAVGADLRLACSWGDMGLGDVQLLQVTAPVEKAPAWQLRTVAALEAGNDRDRGNDVASSVLGILLT